MKKLLTCLLLVNFLFFESLAQKKGAAIAGGIAGGVAAAFSIKAAIESYKEQFEHEATEWVLQNDTLTEFQLKLFNFQASGLDDSNNISAVPFIVKSLNNDQPYVLIFVLSRGWINEFGVDFTYVKPLIFDKEYWSMLLLNYFNISGAVKIDNLDEIPLYKKQEGGGIIPSQDQLDRKEWVKKPRVSQSGKKLNDEYYGLLDVKADITQIHDVNNDNIQFNVGLNKTKVIYEFPLREDLDGDTHIIADIDDQIMLDFNEQNMNIFLKKTSDLFNLKKKMIVDISKELFVKD